MKAKTPRPASRPLHATWAFLSARLSPLSTLGATLIRKLGFLMLLTVALACLCVALISYLFAYGPALILGTICLDLLQPFLQVGSEAAVHTPKPTTCLLYTSDA